MVDSENGELNSSRLVPPFAINDPEDNEVEASTVVSSAFKRESKKYRSVLERAGPYIGSIDEIPEEEQWNTFLRTGYRINYTTWK